jgi:aldose 1-epimerase
MKLSKILFVNLSLLFMMSCNNNETKPNDEVKLPSKENFASKIGDKTTSLFYLKNSNNYQAALTNYGARMVGFTIPDKNGKITDVVVGLDSIGKYVHAEERFYGVIVGRFGNRIAKGQFTLNGKSYQLDLNNGVNALHGGTTGFHSRVWDAKQIDEHSIEFVYVSQDGEEGYPGKLTTKVTYTLNDNNELHIDYEYSTDNKTIANITNHNYWNLNGEGSGTINNHSLKIEATKYTPVDSTLIPTGVSEVKNTPFDFTTFHTIGERIEANDTQLKYGKGYDHNYVADKGITQKPELIATVKADKSGIGMEIFTTEPAVQFYGGNFMQSKHTFKNGVKDDFRTAFCLETQHYPNSPNEPSFPTTVVEPGKVYTSSTVHKFFITK